MSLGAGLGENANSGGGLKIKGTYNVPANLPPLIDGTGKEGLCYRIAVGGTRDFSNTLNPNILQLDPQDLVFYSLRKWVKIDQTFVDTLLGYTTNVQLYAAIEALKGGAAPDGDTLKELLDKINNISVDPLFNGNRTVTRAGLPAVNVGTTTVLTFMEAYYFPAVAPGAAISGGGTRQFGAAVAVTLSWTATKQTNPITAITVAGDSITPTGNTQSGSVSKNATQNVTTTFSIIVTAGAQSTSASTSIVWSHKRYWGKTSKDGSLSPILDSDILGLTGAGSGAGNEFSATRIQTRNSINGAGQYLIFAWPSSFGTPSFIVNNNPNSAWTKVRANSAFINSDGYSEPYDVWVSNTIQNSPLNISIT